jgi:hypothetical protein
LLLCSGDGNLAQVFPVFDREFKKSLLCWILQGEMRPFIIPLLLISVLSLGSCPQKSLAEATCRSEVYYRWKEGSSEDIKKSLWRLLSEAAETVDEAKGNLDKRVIVEKAKAEKECVRQYTRISSCVSAKMLNQAASLKLLDFSARRILEEAIKKECESKAGECLDALHSEVFCVEKKEEAPVEDATAEGGKGGKEDKDKKGK